MKTITKKDLIDRIVDNHAIRRTDVRQAIQGLLDEIIEELAAGNRIEFRDFGVFEVKDRAARMAQNPRTLERVPVPSKRAVKFKPGRRMRDSIDERAEPLEVQIGAGARGAVDPSHNGQVPMADD